MRLVLFSVILLGGIFVPAGNALAQSITKEQASRVYKRMHGVNDNHMSLWTKGFDAAMPTFAPNETKSYSVNLNSAIFVFVFATRLWQGDVFQESLSNSLLIRTTKVPKPVFDEWRKALTDSTGTNLPKLRELALSFSHPVSDRTFSATPNPSESTLAMYFLYQIIQQDELFDQKNDFNVEKSKSLLLRLKTVPREAIVEWSKLIDPDNMGSLHEAATSLIAQDTLFADGAFQEGAFKRRLKEQKSKVRN